MLQRWLVVIIGLPLLLAALLLCPDWVTVIVVCGIAAAAAYELLHTAGKKVPKCVYAFTILAAVAQEWVIYDAHTWQFYEGYQSVGMIRILCVPLALIGADIAEKALMAVLPLRYPIAVLLVGMILIFNAFARKKEGKAA